MHHHSGFSCLSLEQREHPREGQSPGGSCCGYFFILFTKVDLQAVMKAGRWSSGGTFTFFLPLRPLSASWQYTKTRPVVAAGEIVEISSYMGLVTVYFFSSGSYIPFFLVGPVVGGLSYCIFFSSGSYIPLSSVLLYERRGWGVLEDPPRLWIGDVFSLSVESQIMVASESVLADALPYLSECWNSHPPRHPSPRTLIPLEHSSPWNTHPPGTPIPLEHSSPLEHPSPWNTHPPMEHSSPLLFFSMWKMYYYNEFI